MSKRKRNSGNASKGMNKKGANFKQFNTHGKASASKHRTTNK